MNQRLPAITGHDLVRALQKVGWEVSHVRGSHWQLLQSSTGKRATVPVHAGKDLKRGLVVGVLKEVGLTQDELRELL